METNSMISSTQKEVEKIIVKLSLSFFKKIEIALKKHKLNFKTNEEFRKFVESSGRITTINQETESTYCVLLDNKFLLSFKTKEIITLKDFPMFKVTLELNAKK